MSSLSFPQRKELNVMRPLAFEYDLSQHVDEAEPAMLFGGSTVEELTRLARALPRQSA